MTDDPMNPDWVPEPHDYYRGTFAVDFMDHVTPAYRARLEAARRQAEAKRAAANPPPADAPPPAGP